MRIQTSHPDTRHQSSLQQEQNAIALSSSRKSAGPREEPVVISPSSSKTQYRSDTYATYSSQNASPYNQAIRAYQEASRFEPVQTVPLQTMGSILGDEVRGNEKALTDILREEPGNSSAWYDLGIVYSQQGNREKVSAVYQVLQKIDDTMAKGFSTQLGLHEKLLLDVI